MSDSKVIMKVEQEIKPMKDLCDKILNLTKAEVDRGVESVDTEELGEAVDMIKDLAQAKKDIVDACYKMKIMEAMEEAEYGEDYDENGRIRHYGTRGGGRRVYFTYPDPIIDYPMRDMDKNYGRMYYGGSQSSGGSNAGMSGGLRSYSDSIPREYESYNVNMSSKPVEIRDRREGRSPINRKMYMEAKEMHKDKTVQMEELEKYMKELSHDIIEMIEDATPEEKQVLQQKISTLATKIK